MRFANVLALTGALLAGLATSVVAAPITPTYDNFGPFAATFGGSGIPNHAVASSSVTDGGLTFTTALTAHQRFVGPNLDNDGAGTFTALIGESGPGLALWNFAYYFDISGTGDTTGYSAQLLYDFDPAAGTEDAVHGVIDLTSFLAPGFHLEDSQNLGFAFLDTTPPPFITPPTFPSFNPNVAGEYTFAIRVFNGAALLDETSIRVNATPEPGTMVLFGLGALGMAAAGRRRKNKAETL